MEKNVDGIYMIDLSRITIDIPALAANAGYTILVFYLCGKVCNIYHIGKA